MLETEIEMACMSDEQGLRPLPLDGVVVTEAGQRIAAAVCGSLLAQLGATVVAVEEVTPAARRGGKSAHRAQLVAGKRSLLLDPDSGEDRDLLGRLAVRSDVVLRSSDMDAVATGAVAGAGVDGRVICDVSAYGADGPMQGVAESEYGIQALTGIMETTGLPDGPPVPIRVPVVEYMTGIYAAASVLAALRVRRLHGAGQHIDMALYDCGFAAMSSFLTGLLQQEEPADTARRQGSRHPLSAPWNVFAARDGWLLICTGSDVQWQRICDVIGRPELARDTRFAHSTDRVARVREVDALVQEWVERRTIDQCMQGFGVAAVPSGPIVRIDGYPREPNLEYRKMIRRLEGDAGASPLHVPGSPLAMNRTPGRPLLELSAPDADRGEVMRMAAGDGPSKSASTAAAGEAPLAGVRVIEIGHYTTAPVGARHLASLGAEVIKVEPPEGEAARKWPPKERGQSVFYTVSNTDKKSIRVDLNEADGRAVLRRLIETSDVLLENLKPGSLAKRGFSVEEIREMNPRLVYCAVSGFGADSLYSGRPAFDTIVQAMSGLMDLVRSDGVPVKTGISSADVLGAGTALVAILAALEFRDRDGRGQYIDLSMQDIAAWVTQTAWNEGAATAATVAVIPCADGHVVAEEGDAGSLAPGERDAMRTLSREAAVAALRERGLGAAAVRTAREVMEAEQTTARRLRLRGEDERGAWNLLASPLRLQGTPPMVQRPGPALGRDEEEILLAIGMKPRRARVPGSRMASNGEER